jgi:nuclear transport factor 2 (NTF2) superfamily protein
MAPTDTPPTPPSPLRPPFTADTAARKARMAEDGWNSRDPQRVSLAYTEDSRWRNRAEFLAGRAAIVAFLQRKWSRELDYRLIKEVWAFTDNRIAVRFAYEWHDDSGHFYRSHGNEQWEFEPGGLMRRREAPSTTSPFGRKTESFGGRWDLVRSSIPASRTLGCSPTSPRASASATDTPTLPGRQRTPEEGAQRGRLGRDVPGCGCLQGRPGERARASQSTPREG